MKLLADENFPELAALALRKVGHDVLWARTEMAGSPDTAILERARAEDRLIVTFDKDFGELAYLEGLPASSGVIIFRLAPSSPEFVAERAVTVLQSREDWMGKFAIAEESRVRIRSLPESPFSGA